MMEFIGGRIELISGPMFSGKTTELLRRLICDAAVKRKVLYIKCQIDVRSYLTHSPLYDTILSIRIYRELPGLNDIKEYDTIGIDEAQFFDNLDRVKEYADNGKRVIVAGLTGDAQRMRFGQMVELIPHAEDYQSLHALCVKCAEENRLREAAFTYRILPAISNEQIDVGGEEKYIAVCRTHYNKLID